MTRVAATLDGLAVALAALALAVILTGGFTLGVVPVTRPEDVVLAGVGVVGLRVLLKPIRVPPWDPRRAVLTGVAAYAATFSFIAVTRHLALQTHALDLGYYVQLVWSIAHGHGARVSLPLMHAWGDHFSPVLYLFAPVARLAPGALPLLVGQALILASGGLAVFAFAERRLDDVRVAAGFALLYLLNPALHGINIRDFHPQAFAIPLVLGAAVAFDRGRYGWCAVALALTAATREDEAVAVAGFGLWLAFARRRRALGAGVVLAAVALLIVDVRWLIPSFRGAPYPHLGRYAQLGGSLPEILLAPVVAPRALLATALTAAKAEYLLALLAPLGFLPLLAPRALVGAVPGLAITLLTVDHVLFNYRTQYQSSILPFLFLAAVEGHATLAACLHPYRASRRRSPATALVLAALASVALTSRTANELQVTRWWPDEGVRAIYRLFVKVPPGASVATNERFVPHLATRPRVLMAEGTGLTQASWVLERESVVDSIPGVEVVARDGGYALGRLLRADSARAD